MTPHDLATAARRRMLAAAPFVVALLLLLGLASGVPATSAAGVRATDAAIQDRRCGTPAYRVFFGDLHDHTHFSDGQGTPEQAWAQAAAGGADFMAVTDHREGLNATEWARTQTAADAATSPAFVAIPAFEVKPAMGHLNVYGTSELPPIGLNGAALYDWIAAQGALGEWNHPTRNSDDFSGYAHWSATRDAAIALLEVVNHGSGFLYPDFESSYVRALDKGWHVMPAANGDIHDASWITGNNERTALLATALTHEALYEAMRARRGYATKLGGLVVGYTVGGSVMGLTIAPAAGRLPVKVRVSWRSGARKATGTQAGHRRRQRQGRGHDQEERCVGDLDDHRRAGGRPLLLPARVDQGLPRTGHQDRVDGAGLARWRGGVPRAIARRRAH